ncbi:MAG: class I SAM-dependent methyltransferase [Chloroflexi bacterium]|nr:class I SAM-dependent methyltransferase [Chloroflexota bacterium]MCY3938344.1 class I SAM-dependent methyltransferase [Chloroflexota bacterium]
MTQEHNYDPARVRDFFNRLGYGEWERLEQSATSRIQARIHTHYLHRFFERGDRVLDAGAGPGRFTVELARLGATVSVVDISEEQLRLNRQKVTEAGLLDSVDGWNRADILDLGLFSDATFDGTVCYGGGLSYVLERADEALEELLRVTKPGGLVALSVPNVVGTARMSLPGFPAWIERHGREDLDHQMATGDALGTTKEGHWTHMYRWREFEELLLDHRCEIVAASTSGFMSILNDEIVAAFEKDPDFYDWFLRWEIEYSREPGALDGGAQLIAVVRRDGSAERQDTV